MAPPWTFANTACVVAATPVTLFTLTLLAARLSLTTAEPMSEES